MSPVSFLQVGAVPVHTHDFRQFQARFQTTQSKLLEKKGFVRRKPSNEDARIVKMSLTDKTCKHLASLASQQEALNDFIFAEFGARELDELTDKLAALKKRLEKACLKVAADL